MIRPVTARLQVKVQPNATRSEIAGWYGEALKVRTAAPPVSGKANRAVVEILARALNIPRAAVSLTRGHGSRDKVLEIVGIDEPELRRRLERLATLDKPGSSTR